MPRAAVGLDLWRGGGPACRQMWGHGNQYRVLETCVRREGLVAGLCVLEPLRGRGRRREPMGVKGLGTRLWPRERKGLSFATGHW